MGLKRHGWKKAQICFTTHQCTSVLTSVGLNIPKKYTYASGSHLHLNFFLFSLFLIEM